MPQRPLSNFNFGRDASPPDGNERRWVFYDPRARDKKETTESSEQDFEVEIFELNEPSGPVPFTILDRSDLQYLSDEAIISIISILGCSPTAARSLLLQFYWDPEVVLSTVADRDQDEVYKCAGITSRDPTAPTSPPIPNSTNMVTCMICASDVFLQEATTISCNHVFCNHCWRSHISIGIREGKGKRLVCMAHGCGVVIDDSTVCNLLEPQQGAATDINDHELLLLIERFKTTLIDSYVDDNKNVKWCPSAPHCGRAAQAEHGVHCEVSCQCGKEFCFACCEPHHSPATCQMITEWNKRIKEGKEENDAWLNANTKTCPKCKNPVEKNGGCNWIRCRCGQAFCWLCGQGTGGDHTWDGITGHSCGRYQEEAKGVVDAALTSLSRWNHFSSRYKGHMMSLGQDNEVAKHLEDSISALWEENDKAEGGSTSAFDSLSWATDAFSQLTQARRVLANSYVLFFFVCDKYGMFKDDFPPERENIRKCLVEDLLNKQDQLEVEIEKFSMLITTGRLVDHACTDLINRKTTTINTCIVKLYEVIEKFRGELQTSNFDIAPYNGGRSMTSTGLNHIGSLYEESRFLHDLGGITIDNEDVAGPSTSAAIGVQRAQPPAPGHQPQTDSPSVPDNQGGGRGLGLPPTRRESRRGDDSKGKGPALEIPGTADNANHYFTAGNARVYTFGAPAASAKTEAAAPAAAASVWGGTPTTPAFNFGAATAATIRDKNLNARPVFIFGRTSNNEDATAVSSSSGGWDLSFLQQNKAGATAAAEATKKEIEKTAVPAPTTTSAPIFSFGMPPAPPVLIFDSGAGGASSGQKLENLTAQDVDCAATPSLPGATAAAEQQQPSPSTDRYRALKEAMQERDAALEKLVALEKELQVSRLEAAKLKLEQLGLVNRLPRRRYRARRVAPSFPASDQPATATATSATTQVFVFGGGAPASTSTIPADTSVTFASSSSAPSLSQTFYFDGSTVIETRDEPMLQHYHNNSGFPLPSPPQQNSVPLGSVTPRELSSGAGASGSSSSCPPTATTATTTNNAGNDSRTYQRQVSSESLSTRTPSRESQCELVCGICEEPMGDGTERPPAAPRCGHIFCDECLHRWISKERTCPQCRAPSTVSDIRKLYFQ